MSNWTAAEIQEMQHLVVVLNSSGVQCQAMALILKTNSTCFTVHARLRASRHVTPTPVEAFGKEEYYSSVLERQAAHWSLYLGANVLLFLSERSLRCFMIPVLLYYQLTNLVRSWSQTIILDRTL